MRTGEFGIFSNVYIYKKNIYKEDYVHEYIHRRIGKFVRFDELTFGLN